MDLRKRQRTFGISAGLVCALVVVHHLRRGHVEPAAAFGLLGLALVALGWLAPGLLRYPSAAWWRGLHALGWVNTRLMLAAVFFVVLTPTGIILRLLRWDPLMLKRRPGQTSAWVPYPESHRDPKHYERMY